MRVVALWLAVSMLLFGSCRSNDIRDATGTLCDPTEPLPSPAPSFPPARALIDTGDDSVLLNLEIAESPEQQEFGLMHRESFPDDCGMAFLFMKERSGAFWMKDTLIPLSVAFFDEEGKILEILDMEPCERDPCRFYDPGVRYHGALEVNQGFFEEHGIDIGDEISITRDI